jgi:hypothetical protein
VCSSPCSRSRTRTGRNLPPTALANWPFILPALMSLVSEHWTQTTPIIVCPLPSFCLSFMSDHMRLFAALHVNSYVECLPFSLSCPLRPMNEHMSRCRLRTLLLRLILGEVLGCTSCLSGKKSNLLLGAFFFGLIGRVSRSGIPVQQMALGFLS